MSEESYSAIDGGDSPPDAKTLVFRGISGIECEHFVRSVRFIALAEGQDEDDRWMLRFATARLAGKALRWHAGLDKEIRKDWDLLVQALLNEYPVDQPEAIVSAASIAFFSDVSSMAPTVTSTLPSPRRSILSPGLNVGRLRIVPQSGYAGALYISRSIGIITARADALLVQFLQSADPHRIGMLECDRWGSNKGLVRESGCVLAVNPPLSKLVAIQIYASHAALRSKEFTKCWRVGSDGVVGIADSTPGSKRPTLVYEGEKLVVDLVAQTLQFTPDPISLIQSKGAEAPDTHYEARLVFEPLSNEIDYTAAENAAYTLRNPTSQETQLYKLSI